MDFCKDELMSYFLSYRDKYDELYKICSENAVQTEYGRGGKVLHRGFYCPSPVQDIVIGNCNRGKLLHTPKKPPDYIYFKDADGKLIQVDKCGSHSGVINIYEREFLIYQGCSVIAPRFELYSNDGGSNLYCISVCKYSQGGKILSYKNALFCDAFKENVSVDNMEVVAEDYNYNRSGQLESSELGKVFHLSSVDRFKYFHNDEGFLTSYTCLLSGSSNETFHEVSRSKWRKI